MSDTLGSLVDKLITCNIKLYMVQDQVHNAAQSGEGLDKRTVSQLHMLNLQRNRLMTEVDQCLSNAVESGEAEVDPHVKLT